MEDKRTTLLVPSLRSKRSVLYRYKTRYSCVKVEVFMAVTMKNPVFLDVTPRGSFKNWHFGVTYLLHHSYDGDYMFLRNVRSYKSYTASHPRRRHSSLDICFPRIYRSIPVVPERILFKVRPPSPFAFPYASFFFRAPEEKNESTFHCILPYLE
jgi:hypothetical protein